MHIDENTNRATLEEVAIIECGIDPDTIIMSTDNQLRQMIYDWISEGDECGDC